MRCQSYIYKSIQRHPGTSFEYDSMLILFGMTSTRQNRLYCIVGIFINKFGRATHELALTIDSYVTMVVKFQATSVYENSEKICMSGEVTTITRCLDTKKSVGRNRLPLILLFYTVYQEIVSSTRWCIDSIGQTVYMSIMYIKYIHVHLGGSNSSRNTYQKGKYMSLDVNHTDANMTNEKYLSQSCFKYIPIFVN